MTTTGIKNFWTWNKEKIDELSVEFKSQLAQHLLFQKRYFSNDQNFPISEELIDPLNGEPNGMVLNLPDGVESMQLHTTQAALQNFGACDGANFCRTSNTDYGAIQTSTYTLTSFSEANAIQSGAANKSCGLYINFSYFNFIANLEKKQILGFLDNGDASEFQFFEPNFFPSPNNPTGDVEVVCGKNGLCTLSGGLIVPPAWNSQGHVSRMSLAKYISWQGPGILAYKYLTPDYKEIIINNRLIAENYKNPALVGYFVLDTKTVPKSTYCVSNCKEGTNPSGNPWGAKLQGLLLVDAGKPPEIDPDVLDEISKTPSSSSSNAKWIIPTVIASLFAIATVILAIMLAKKNHI